MPPRAGRRFGRGRKRHEGRFDPRPREGGDQIATGLTTVMRCFDPRPREGGDAGCQRFRRVGYGFDPRPREGGRRAVLRCGYLGERFDPRPREGGDSAVLENASQRKCFDPRPRVGGDAVFRIASAPTNVSIHAPAWGATDRVTIWPAPRGFRSTPPRGGRQIRPQ